MGAEARRWHNTQTNCHKLSYLLSILLRVHLSFLKTIPSPLSGLHLCDLSLWWWFMLHCECLWELLIFHWVSPCICEVHMCINLSPTLLICHLIWGSQLRTQRSKGKIIFSSFTRSKRDNIINFQVIKDTFKSVLACSQSVNMSSFFLCLFLLFFPDKPVFFSL